MILSTPAEIYVVDIKEVLWGAVLVALTMAIHPAGMVLTLRTIGTFKRRLLRKSSYTSHLVVLIIASWFITFVHLVEVSVWAEFFLWKQAMPNFSTAYYFSLMDYTTLGSNYNLPIHWRLLAGMIAIAGLMTFAWSTSILLALAQEFRETPTAVTPHPRTER
jgi:hypothetical protein